MTEPFLLRFFIHAEMAHFMHTQYIHVIDKVWFGLNFLFCIFVEALILMRSQVTYCVRYDTKLCDARFRLASLRI